MLDIQDKCVGCGSCSISCPTNSILMSENQEGFRYPIIDGSSCVKCHICEEKCPVLKPVKVFDQMLAMAVKNKDEEIRMKSSSGGVFATLAEYVIQEGGIVCAATFNHEFKVSHKLFDSCKEITKYCGAKYVQSQFELCMQDIKKHLEFGRKVLFIGTPCQCAGLLRYLDKDYSNLILVDMVCHGVPSPKVWKRYLDELCDLESKKLEIDYINFRSKVTGWSKYSYSIEIVYKNGIKYSSMQSKDPYMQGFTSNLFLRTSCADCSFKGIKRCSDITLGDYWGIWAQHSEFDDNKGVSMVLLHTHKAKCIWKNISEHFDIKEVSVDEAIKYNPSAISSSIPHMSREEFFNRIETEKSLISLINDLLVSKKDNKKSLAWRVFERLKGRV